MNPSQPLFIIFSILKNQERMPNWLSLGHVPAPWLDRQSYPRSLQCGLEVSQCKPWRCSQGIRTAEQQNPQVLLHGGSGITGLHPQLWRG